MPRAIYSEPPILPSNQTPQGALPARFRRQRLLVVGCGDVGLRVVQALNRGVHVLALTSSPQRVAGLRQKGVTPLLGNLDDAASLRRLAGIAQRVLHLAPPPAGIVGDNLRAGRSDPRTRELLWALRQRGAPLHLVYGSTSGVYGDCQGEWVAETRAVNAQSDRAARRVDAERRVRHYGRAAGVPVNVLRIPGIYALDRPHGTPATRLQKGTPVLRAQDDVFTNHIHADDLARACLAALWRGRAQRVFNVNDDTQLAMGDYFDLAADVLGLPRPPRLAREEARAQLSPMAISFMSESRRLDNRRMKQELRLRLRHATVQSGLRAAGGSIIPKMGMIA
jgi:nucleoside-diphosphate-sugar epimerase